MGTDITACINWKGALIMHTILFSFALLQESFLLGQLWTIVNVFVFFLLLRAVYSSDEGKRNNFASCWYFYALSIFTDLLSICIFGKSLAESMDFHRFILAMACMMFIPKPLFAFFMWKDLKQYGFDIKQDLKKASMLSAIKDDTYQGLESDVGDGQHPNNNGNNNQNHADNNNNNINPGQYNNHLGNNSNNNQQNNNNTMNNMGYSGSGGGGGGLPGYPNINNQSQQQQQQQYQQPNNNVMDGDGSANLMNSIVNMNRPPPPPQHQQQNSNQSISGL